MNNWLQVHGHEMSRRRRIAQANKKLFKAIHSTNPKGLLEERKCQNHCWVPATHLMIHDNGSRSTSLGGVKTRGFLEAKVFSDATGTIVPQICWRCDATRELTIENISTAEREAQFKANRPRRARRSKSEPVESLLGMLEL